MTYQVGDIQVGDIVTVDGRAGLWAVADLNRGSARGWPLDVAVVQRQGDTLIQFTTGPEALELVLRPEFTPGLRLRWWQEEVAVVERRGDRVRLERFARVPLSCGFASWRGELEVNAGALVAENLKRIQETTP